MKKKGLRAYGLIVVLLTAAALAQPAAGIGAEEDGLAAAIGSSALPAQSKAELTEQARSAVRAGIPAEDVDIIVRRGLARNAGAGEIGKFLAVAVRVRDRDLPTAAVLDRIEQGLAKNVPAKRIEAAAERLGDKLGAARPIVDALGRGGTRADRDGAIEAAARAMENGLAAGDVERIGRAVAARKGTLALFGAAVNAAAHLTERGMDSEKAAGLVGNALAQGKGERELAAMEKGSDKEPDRGARPEDGSGRERDRDRRDRDRGRGSDMGGRRR